jgi:signal transduction histidine kinase
MTGEAERTRILLVDDEQANLVALEVVLAPLGQELVRASSGTDALRRLLQQDFALVLLDVRMPDMDGLEVAQLIRSRPSTRTLPIIFLTGYTEAEHDLREAYRLGAADFIFKPINPEFLRAKVGVFVDLHRQQRRVSELLLQAEAAGRAKSEFLRMAAHELRTPLGIINGYLSMLREGTFGKPPQTWTSPLGVLSRKVRELTALVNDILEASRVEAGPVTCVARCFDLRETAADALDRARTRLEDLDAELEADLPPEPVWVYADRDHVGRILDNLLDNALTYSREQPWARLAVRTDEQAVIEVEDRGVGIAPELRERVFERLFRIDDPELTTRPGTGLGLYISRALALSNGGWLEVGTSEPGAGTQMVLSLPLAEESMVLAAEADRRAPGGQGRQVS